MSNNKVAGVFAAVPTPYTADFGPDIDLFLEHCNWVLDSGCDGINVLGTTGEANSQSLQARASIMRAAADSNLDRGGLMVGTGTPSLHETIELTQLAASLGYDAALVLPPYYYKPVTDDGLFEFFSQVFRAVADSELGIYLYNFPQLTGMTFSTELVERLIGAFPRQLCGMKDSSGDMPYTENMAATFAGSFDVFPGSEAPLPDSVEKGYAGCISASVNATAVIAAKVWQTREQVAAEDAAELRALRGAIQAVPIVAGAKMLTARRTGRDEWRRVLPPLSELTTEQEQSLADVADRLGFSGTPGAVG